LPLPLRRPQWLTKDSHTGGLRAIEHRFGQGHGKESGEIPGGDRACTFTCLGEMIATEAAEGANGPFDRTLVGSGKKRFPVEARCAQKLGRKIDLATPGMNRQKQQETGDRLSNPGMTGCV
jgi:hypothetical protein